MFGAVVHAGQPSVVDPSEHARAVVGVQPHWFTPSQVSVWPVPVHAGQPVVVVPSEQADGVPPSAQPHWFTPLHSRARPWGQVFVQPVVVVPSEHADGVTVPALQSHCRVPAPGGQ